MERSSPAGGKQPSAPWAGEPCSSLARTGPCFAELGRSKNGGLLVQVTLDATMVTAELPRKSAPRVAPGARAGQVPSTLPAALGGGLSPALPCSSIPPGEDPRILLPMSKTTARSQNKTRKAKPSAALPGAVLSPASASPSSPPQQLLRRVLLLALWADEETEARSGAVICPRPRSQETGRAAAPQGQGELEALPGSASGQGPTDPREMSSLKCGPGHREQREPAVPARENPGSTSALPSLPPRASMPTSSRCRVHPRTFALAAFTPGTHPCAQPCDSLIFWFTFKDQGLGEGHDWGSPLRERQDRAIPGVT